jgi:hypothetical protein
MPSICAFCVVARHDIMTLKMIVRVEETWPGSAVLHVV